ncbi:MAG TPA: hypothetical protein VEJ63_23085 [Planctomycetota bacterium]|nr:hypothetical protein [Planctomycetota bacterium]
MHQCPRCQSILALSAEFESAVASELSARNPSAFSAAVLARLPKASAPAAAKGFVVVAAPTPRRWTWGLAAAVVLLALSAVIGFASGIFQKQVPASAFAPNVARGRLTDAQGKSAQKLETGTRYTAREQSVVALNDATLLKLETGTKFEVSSDENPGVRLAAGDMYASTAAPLRVSLRNFETDLHGGEYFVAQEDALGMQGVVIVFSGQAHVRVNRNADLLLPLNPGQVYYSVEENGEMFADTVAASEVKPPKDLVAATDDEKRLYADRVKGFEAELAEVRTQLARLPESAQQRSELQKRAGLIEKYLHDHRQRLEAMGGVDHPRKLPYEQIQRGLMGRTDPATWRM